MVDTRAPARILLLVTGVFVNGGIQRFIHKRAIERLSADAALREHLRERGRSVIVGDGEFTFAHFTRCAGTIFSPNENRAA
jgi:hypothetical protein